MMMRPLPFLERATVIGANGFVGRHLVDALSLVADTVIACTSAEQPPTWQPEANVQQYPLSDAAAFDSAPELFASGPVFMLPQLQRPSIDWMLDRIDGPRWVVFSSAQLSAAEVAPGYAVAASRERAAAARGATVIRPTMIFGRGGDKNLTSVIRTMGRTRVPVQMGDGGQLVQPIHVDDLIDLLLRVGHQGGQTGVFEAGGSEQLPSRELMAMISELLGVRTPVLSVPNGVLSAAAVIAPIAGLRADQIRRLVEDKVVDNTAAMTTFGWTPDTLAHRLEAAVAFVGFGSEH
ncbi:MAG: nucleoside-diphosphate-sugar epimerase [Candidatus Poriferisodalaceae bacterium]|jgi:nucleoside-diphosphate-sugar epimerase